MIGEILLGIFEIIVGDFIADKIAQKLFKKKLYALPRKKRIVAFLVTCIAMLLAVSGIVFLVYLGTTYK